MSCGTAVTKPASAAPAPSATKSAGRAQQTNVPVLVKSDVNTSARFLCSVRMLFFYLGFSDHVARVEDKFLYLVFRQGLAVLEGELQG